MATRLELRNIRAAAEVRLESLAGTFADAKSGTREGLLARMDFERELLDACDDASAEPAWPDRFSNSGFGRHL